MWIDEQIVKHCDQSIYLDVFCPPAPLVVLGRGNQANQEVFLDYCAANHIPVTKRLGGGGAVVLYEDCVIISLGCWVRHHFDNKRYFQLINKAIINCLAKKWQPLKNLTQRGISDLSYGHKKLGGTSLFRSKGYLLYQASLIVHLNIELIEHCLKHPSTEPDYRKNRPHKDFMTDLHTVDGSITTDLVVKHLKSHLMMFIKQELNDDLTEPLFEHGTYLKNKAQKTVFYENRRH